jgi:hypothetical protein
MAGKKKRATSSWAVRSRNYLVKAIAKIEKIAKGTETEYKDTISEPLSETVPRITEALKALEALPEDYKPAGAKSGRKARVTIGDKVVVSSKVMDKLKEIPTFSPKDAAESPVVTAVAGRYVEVKFPSGRIQMFAVNQVKAVKAA